MQKHTERNALHINSSTGDFVIWKRLFVKLGGELPYKSDRNARRKIKIQPLRETNMGVAQA